MAATNGNNNHNVVTLKDIADHCGVTVATVSRALRNPERHSKATTERILEVAAELGYDPLHHQGARRLALSRFGKRIINHLLAVIFPPYFYRANYFAEIFQGLLDVLTPEGYGLLTVNIENDTPLKLPPSFSRGDVDGVISLTDAYLMPQTAAQLRNEPFFGQRPVLSLFFATPGCSAVLIDAQGGAYAAAGHLLDQGHRHLLHFCGPETDAEWSPQDWSYQLLLGFQRAFVDRGLDPAQHLHYFSLDTKLRDLALQAVNHPKLLALDAIGFSANHPLLRTLRAHPEITGILARNDPAALLIRHLLHQGGLRVPEDISLVGFDDTNPMFNERGQNILTTVRLPLRQIGRRAARLMIRQVNDEKTPQEVQIVLPATLIVRGSTAPPAAR